MYCAAFITSVCLECKSPAIDRSASNYTNVRGKVQKIKQLISTGTYDADIAKYIPGTLDLVYHGMLEDTGTKEKAAHFSYKNMEQLDFQIMLTDNYYANPNSMHLCFPMTVKQLSNEANDIDNDLITVNNFFAHLIK